jgi:hypothetical protein
MLISIGSLKLSSSESELEQESDPEAFQEIARLVKKRDRELQALKTELDELKQKCVACIAPAPEKQRAREQVLAYCVICKHGLTNTDIQKPVCPHCGQGTKYSSQPEGE